MAPRRCAGSFTRKRGCGLRVILGTARTPPWQVEPLMGSDLLEKSEKSIREACHQKLEAACLIGEEPGKIEKEELFRARGYASFETYLRDQGPITQAEARRFRKIERTVAILRNAGLALPATEEEASLLAKIDEALLPEFWKIILEHQEQPSSLKLLKDAVRFMNKPRSESQRESSERPGVEVNWN
jgi:hypothetical protein